MQITSRHALHFLVSDVRHAHFDDESVCNNGVVILRVASLLSTQLPDITKKLTAITPVITI